VILFQEQRMNDFRAEQEALLVMQGYTVSVGKTAALGRISNSFIMRDIHGNRGAIPINNTTRQDLVHCWANFRANALRQPERIVSCSPPRDARPRRRSSGLVRSIEVTAPIWTQQDLPRLLASGGASAGGQVVPSPLR
jgi:hypothetical protein